MRILIKIIAIIILLSGCDTSSKNEWSQFRGNLENTGYTKSKGPNEMSNVKWKFKTEGQVWSSPAVSDGVVYFGNNDGFLYAVSINSGHEKWKFKTEESITSCPAVSDGLVYFGSVIFGDVDGYFYAVDIRTGQEKWKFKTEESIRSSPAVSDGVVYFGSEDGYLYALE